MRRDERFSAPTIGATSLLVIFAVLCLTVFALLCLSTTQAERRLADASLASVQAYYDADRQAQEIYARLRTGELPAEVACDGENYSYSVAVSENQTLIVELSYDGMWHVLRWQTITADTATEDALDVWDGMMEELP